MKKNLLAVSASETEQAKTTHRNEYLEIKIPRISFKNTSINIYLVISLVIFAFLLGMLTNKVIYLENSLKAQETNATQQIQNTAVNTNNTITQAPTPPPKVNVSNGHLPSLGADNAKVTVVEFSDFQCPFCKQFQDNTYPQIYDTYIKTNKIKFVYRQYPLTTIHPNAEQAAIAAECANEQGKFWEYHDVLFTNQNTWAPQAVADAGNSFADYAGQLGLNTDQFRSCLNTNKYKQNVDNDAADGNTAAVDGTPTFFINGWRLIGALPFAQMQQLIEQELKK